MIINLTQISVQAVKTPPLKKDSVPNASYDLYKNVISP